MDLDGDAHVDQHMWRLTSVVLAPGEQSVSEYECDLCDGLLIVPAGQMPPTTA